MFSCDNTNMQEDSSITLPTDNLPQNYKSSSQSLDLKNPENENNDQIMLEDAQKTNDSDTQCEDEKDKDNPIEENEANKEDEDTLKDGMKNGQYERRRSTRLNKAGLDPVIEKAIRSFFLPFIRPDFYLIVIFQYVFCNDEQLEFIWPIITPNKGDQVISDNIRRYLRRLWIRNNCNHPIAWE